MTSEATKSMGLWIAIGIAIGVGIGAAMDNIGVGIAIGAGIGAALGTAMTELNGDRKREPDPNTADTSADLDRVTR